MRSGIVLLAAWLLAPAPEAWAGQAGPEAEPITLARVLAAGRAESPAIAAARSREDAAAAAAGVAGRWRNPAIELRSENWGAGVPGGLRKDSFATLTQTLELGGKRGARRATALAAAEAARAGTLAALRATERDIAARFLEAVRLRDRTGILMGQRDALDELVHILERRVAEGLAPDAERARLAAERTAVAIAVTRSRSGGRPGFFGTPGARRPSGRDNGGGPRPARADPGAHGRSGGAGQRRRGRTPRCPHGRRPGRDRTTGAPSGELPADSRPDGEHRPEADARDEHRRFRAGSERCRCSTGARWPPPWRAERSGPPNSNTRRSPGLPPRTPSPRS